MTPTFTPNNETLKRMKVLESPDLIAILKKMEEGYVLRQSTNGGSYFLLKLNQVFARDTVAKRNIRTLETAGLIFPTEYEDYIEYRLTYTGSFEELVRNENR